MMMSGESLEEDTYSMDGLLVTDRSNENDYRDVLLERLMEENAFLKDEIVFLREVLKRKSDQTQYLMQTLSKKTEQHESSERRHRIILESSFNRGRSHHPHQGINKGVNCDFRSSNSQCNDLDSLFSDDSYASSSSRLNGKRLKDQHLESQQGFSTIMEKLTCLSDEMKEIRGVHQKMYLDSKSRDCISFTRGFNTQRYMGWPPKTMAVLGDSMLPRLDEKRCGRKKYKMSKVKGHIFMGRISNL